MEQIHLDDGLISVCINDDPDRVIKINPTDFNMYTRIKSAMAEIESLKSDFEERAKSLSDNDITAISDLLSDTDARVRKCIDYIFAAPVSDVVFGEMSSIALVNDKLAAQDFLESITPIIQKRVKRGSGIMKKQNDAAKKYVK